MHLTFNVSTIIAHADLKIIGQCSLCSKLLNFVILVCMPALIAKNYVVYFLHIINPVIPFKGRLLQLCPLVGRELCIWTGLQQGSSDL